MALYARLKSHWQPIAGTALIVLLGLLAAGLHARASLHTQSQQLDSFGQTLARSTAQRAVDATLSQDMISLQVVLQELTRHPQVIGATIHDVENHLLVQSGFPPGEAEPGQFRRYTATIALADNIAGHLQVAMIPPALSGADRQFLLLWSLLVLAAAALPWLPALRRPPVIVQGQSTPDVQSSQVPSDESADDDDDKADTPPPAQLRLRLRLLNMETLSRQLNEESFAQQLSQFEQQLRNILSLYSGKQVALSGDTLLIDFFGESDSDCAFRALCSAQLLGELSHLNPGPKLKLAARIHPLPHRDLTAAFQDQQSAATPGASGIEIAPELIDDELHQHLELDVDTGVLIGVKAPYRQLLDKQQAQLQRLIGADPDGH